MSEKIDDGGPAFSLTQGQCHAGHPGMSLRDYFAGQAVGPLIATRCGPEIDECETKVARIVEVAYWVADAMLAARKDNPDAVQAK